jgi:hypothetical protein
MRRFFSSTEGLNFARAKEMINNGPPVSGCPNDVLYRFCFLLPCNASSMTIHWQCRWSLLKREGGDGKVPH